MTLDAYALWLGNGGLCEIQVWTGPRSGLRAACREAYSPSCSLYVERLGGKPGHGLLVRRALGEPPMGATHMIRRAGTLGPEPEWARGGPFHLRSEAVGYKLEFVSRDKGQ